MIADLSGLLGEFVGSVSAHIMNMLSLAEPDYKVLDSELASLPRHLRSPRPTSTPSPSAPPAKDEL